MQRKNFENISISAGERRVIYIYTIFKTCNIPLYQQASNSLTSHDLKSNKIYIMTFLSTNLPSFLFELMEVNKKTYAGYLQVKFSELWKIIFMDLSQNSGNN